MRFTSTPIDGAVVIDLDPMVDDRGFFARAWDDESFRANGIDATIAQMNMSQTLEPGTFRGFHWNPKPNGEAKTVRCVAGAAFDVIVDMRPDSPTFRASFGIELSATNLRMLHIPQEVANGFLILEPATTLLYSTSRAYTPGVERGCRHDDPSLAIDWPMPVSTTSDKDRSWPDLGWS